MLRVYDRDDLGQEGLEAIPEDGNGTGKEAGRAAKRKMGMRIGIVGCADIALKRFLPAAATVEGVESVAVAEEYAPERLKAFQETGVDPDFYTRRARSEEEYLPWEIIDCGVSKQYMLQEMKKAMEGVQTRDCRKGCTGCGVKRFVECPVYEPGANYMQV